MIINLAWLVYTLNKLDISMVSYLNSPRVLLLQLPSWFLAIVAMEYALGFIQVHIPLYASLCVEIIVGTAVWLLSLEARQRFVVRWETCWDNRGLGDILCIRFEFSFSGGPMMPATQLMEMLKFDYFSRYFSGDIITSIRNPKHAAIKTMGRFWYHPFVVTGNTIVRNMKNHMDLYKKGKELYRRNGNMMSLLHQPVAYGIIALITGRIIGARVIIEVNGNFESAFKYGRMGRDRSITDRINKGGILESDHTPCPSEGRRREAAGW